MADRVACILILVGLKLGDTRAPKSFGITDDHPVSVVVCQWVRTK